MCVCVGVCVCVCVCGISAAKRDDILSMLWRHGKCNYGFTWASRLMCDTLQTDDDYFHPTSVFGSAPVQSRGVTGGKRKASWKESCEQHVWVSKGTGVLALLL